MTGATEPEDTLDRVEHAYHRLSAMLQYLPEADRLLVADAYHVAREAHNGQNRKSGEPYICHPLAIAQTLAQMRMDAASLATALLHDVLEDTPLTYEDLRQEFGVEIAQLVLGLTKFDERVEALRTQRLQNLGQLSPEQRNAASLGNLFLAMTADLRVIVIKLADRLHNMQTLDALKPDKRQRMAIETDELFVPTATRLGIWFLKQQLSDLCLKELHPETYAEIEELLAASTRLLASDLEGTLQQLREHLQACGLNAMVLPLDNPVSTYYRKIKEQGGDPARIYDTLRVYVVVPTLPECYLALCYAHQLWPPLREEFRDYIAAPEHDLYRALHTTVVGPHGHRVEIRIYTEQMRQLAKYGIGVYLQYGQTEPLPQLSLLKEITSLLEEDPQTFITQLKSEMTPPRIRVFTPNGDVISLPVGATPLDFAYAIHTEVGDKCLRALVNRQPVPLNTPLTNGAQVEIITKLDPGPERKWMDTDLGYARHPDTLRRLRRWFARLPQAELIQQGREVIEKEIARWGECDGWTPASIERFARRRGLTVEDFCLRVGRGDLLAGSLSAAILDEVLEGTPGQSYTITLEIYAMDRPGLMFDALKIVVDEGLNVADASAHQIEAEDLAVLHFVIKENSRVLARIAHRLEEVRSMLRVRRIQSLPKVWEGS